MANLKKKCFVGIDVGGTKISGLLVNDKGKALARVKVPTPAAANAQKILAVLTASVRECARLGGVSTTTLRGIGIGFPGLVDQKQGKVLVTPNLNLKNFQAVSLMQRRFKVKTAIGNDVNLGLLGEKYHGAARGAKEVISLFLGTGIGGAILIEGKLSSGFHGAAAEMGHVLLDPLGPRCTCGNRGCLEAYAGRWAIERDIHAALKGHKKSKMNEWLKGKNKRIKSKMLRKALKKRDPVVTKIMKEAVARIAQACVSLRHIFDPELFLFGGGAIEAYGEFVLPQIEAALGKDAFFSKFFKPCKVVAAGLGDDAVMLGAICLVQEELGIRPV